MILNVRSESPNLLFSKRFGRLSKQFKSDGTTRKITTDEYYHYITKAEYMKEIDSFGRVLKRQQAKDNLSDPDEADAAFLDNRLDRSDELPSDNAKNESFLTRLNRMSSQM